QPSAALEGFLSRRRQLGVRVGRALRRRAEAPHGNAGEKASRAERRPTARKMRQSGWVRQPGARVVAEVASRPHHSATKSAIVPVMRLSELRLTRSSKPWMFSEIGP